MNRERALRRYDLEMRARPYLPRELTAQTDHGVLRVTGDYNCIVYTDIADEEAEAAIDAQAAYFEALGEEVEWKVHAHDRPADLGQRLAARGFEPDPAETLLAFDLTQPLPPAPVPNGTEIRRIGDLGGLDDFVTAVTAGFESDRSNVREEFAARLTDPTVGLYVAYADGEPVAAGRIDLPPDRPFAGMYSGAVAPEFRRRGLYRALVEARAEAACVLGFEFLMVEALPTSRPILERLGFEALTTVQGWIWRPAS